jgi:thiol-disulfide isomerase/thioredoxin
MSKQIFRITLILALCWLTNAAASSIEEKFKPLSGQTIDLSPLSVKPGQYDLTIVHFWGTYCPQCIDEMEWLDTFAGHMKNKKVLVVAIALDIKDKEELKEYYSSRNLNNLKPFIDESGQVFSAVGVLGVPTTIFVNRDSKMIGKSVGPIKWDNVDFNKWHKEYKEKQSAANCKNRK